MGNEFRPSGELSEWNVASYGSHDHWFINEGEKISEKETFEIKAFEEKDLWESDMITVRFKDSDGNDMYYVIPGPFDDWESFADYIDDMWEDYGGEPA